jgi:Carboxymuconolactone decarboxylase family
MPRLDYADPNLNADSRTQFARLPINLTRMLLHAPAETKGFLDLVSGFRRGVLDPKLRETVILRVATDEENLYQRMQHLPAAAQAGLSKEEVDAITRGDLARLDPRLAVAVRFVDECVTRVKVSDATFGNARHRSRPRSRRLVPIGLCEPTRLRLADAHAARGMSAARPLLEEKSNAI